MRSVAVGTAPHGPLGVLIASRLSTVGLALLAGAAVAGRAAAQDTTRSSAASPSPAASTPARGVWGAAPPSLPPGAEMMVIIGDPAAAGPLAIALRMPDGYTLLPITFGHDARVTVMEGRFVLSRGPRTDGKGTTLTPFSDVQTLTADEIVSGRARGRTVLQVESVGPFAPRSAAANAPTRATGERP